MMRLAVAGAALTLAVLTSVPSGAQVDPFSGAPLDPPAGTGGGLVDPYRFTPLGPGGVPLDPYEAQPEPPAGIDQPGDSMEMPQGQDLAPFSEGAIVPAEPAAPERVANEIAEFSGLDKITGRITSFDVAVDETVQFGALQVTPRACYSAPPEETPKTDTFVEIDEITLDRDIRRIFTGWMFADSPGLNAVEHPVYDVWLRECRSGGEPAEEAAASGD